MVWVAVHVIYLGLKVINDSLFQILKKNWHTNNNIKIKGMPDAFIDIIHTAAILELKGDLAGYGLKLAYVHQCLCFELDAIGCMQKWV